MTVFRNEDNDLPVKFTYPICKSMGSDEYTKAVWGVLPLRRKIPLSDITIIKDG